MAMDDLDLVIELHKRAGVETGPKDGGIPERWFAANKRRCFNGHVSRRILRSEELGRDVCLACGAPVHLTFPEDQDGPFDKEYPYGKTEREISDHHRQIWATLRDQPTGIITKLDDERARLEIALAEIGTNLRTYINYHFMRGGDVEAGDLNLTESVARVDVTLGIDDPLPAHEIFDYDKWLRGGQ